MKKSILSLSILFCLLLSLSTNASALNLSNLDKDTLHIISDSASETFVGAVTLYPTMLVISTDKDKSYLYTNDDYSENWNKSNIGDNFIATNIVNISSMVMVSGYDSKTLKAKGYFSYGLVDWSEIQLDKIKGQIVQGINIDSTNYLFVSLDKNSLIANFTRDGYNWTEKEINGLPQDLRVIYYKGYFMACDTKNIYQSVDGYNWKTFAFEDLIKENDVNILSYEFTETKCNKSSMTVIYDVKGVKNQLQIYTNDDGTYGVFPATEGSELAPKIYDVIPYNSVIFGEWGYPQIILSGNKFYSCNFTIDAQQLPCMSKNTYWVTRLAEPSGWANLDINSAAKSGIVTPRTIPSDFQKDITRKEFAELCYNLLNKHISFDKEGVYFKDTSSYQVSKLASLGIIKGNGDKFYPDRTITRQEASAILDRIMTLLKLTPDENSVVNLKDINSVDDWARNSVENVNKAGLMNGNANHEFMPFSKYTVEQSIVTLLRLDSLQYLTSQKVAENNQ